MRIVIGAYIPSNMPASDIYRGSGVLSQLRKLDSNIDVHYDMKADWDSLQHIDIVFIMKMSSPDAVRLMEMAHQCGKKVWYDCDDDLFNIPIDNVAYAYYNNLEPGAPWVKDNIRKLLANADVVTVSTENLKKAYSTYSKNIVVIPNAINDYMLKGFGYPQVERKKFITWGKDCLFK